MRKTINILGILAIIGACSVLLYFKIQNVRLANAANLELVNQREEKKECQRRLALFYSAWKRYRADHKGAEPGNIEALIPRYLPDARSLYCPTAQRWETHGKRLEQGYLDINKTRYPVTYGFQWLTSGATRSRKKLGDSAPLVTCEAHRQATYVAVFKKFPPLDAFDSEQRRRYTTSLKDAPTLAVLENGKVIDLAPEN